MTYSDPPEAPKKKPYPVLLRVICMLSGVNGIFFSVTHLLAATEGNTSQGIDATIDNIVKQLPDLNKAYIVEYYDHLQTNMGVYNLSNGLLFILGLIGVYEMFRLRKRGFLMYTIAHIAISLYPIVMVHHNPFSEILLLQSGAITLLFVVLYAVNLKHMK